MNWSQVAGAVGYEIAGRISGGSWIFIQIGGSATTVKDVFGLQPSTTYEWRVRTWCNASGTMKSAFSETEVFTTGAGSRLEGVEYPFNSKDVELSMTVFPNPFSQVAKVVFDNPQNESYSFRLMDLSGKVQQQIENITGNEILIERNALPAGLYYLELHGSSNTFRSKIMIE